MVTLACLYSNPLSCTVLQAGKPTLAWSRRCWRNPQASSISHIFSHYLVKRCMVRILDFSFSFLLTICHTHSFMNSPSLSLLSLFLILLSAFLSILEAIIFRRSRTHKRAVLRHHVGMTTRYLTVCSISSFWSIARDQWLMCDIFALLCFLILHDFNWPVWFQGVTLTPRCLMTC